MRAIDVAVAKTRTAPCLATADIPAATVIAADSSHWNVATNALIRAVALDGLRLDHPAVRLIVAASGPSDLFPERPVVFPSWLRSPAD